MTSISTDLQSRVFMGDIHKQHHASTVHQMFSSFLLHIISKVWHGSPTESWSSWHTQIQGNEEIFHVDLIIFFFFLSTYLKIILHAIKYSRMDFDNWRVENHIICNT